MLTRRSLVGLWTGALAALCVATSTPTVDAGERVRLAVVVAKSSPVNELSLRDLKRLYMGEQLNESGKKLIPLNNTPLSQERVAFDKAVLNMSAEEAARYWIDRKIRGQTGAPKSVGPSDLLQRVVSKVDGSLGYVRPNEIKEDVKVVKIDGKSPTDKGYPVEF